MPIMILWSVALLLAIGLQGVAGVPTVQADSRGVRVQGKQPAEFVAAQTGKSWAVVIGINEYEKAQRLTYAKADAESIADLLRHQGFQVIELYDHQATRPAILEELGDKLVERVGEQDRILIYFAGHGETKQSKGGKEMGYLLPVDAEPDGLARTAIPMSTIRDVAEALPAKHVLFLVDVCYGGIAGQQFRGQPKYNEDYLKAITRERGRQLITAGGPTQQAMEGPEWGHSVFSYFLLEGLRKGTADLNSDGIIPATELYAYLDERVFSAARLKGHQQRPVLWSMAAEKGEFVFVTTQGQGGLAAASTSGEEGSTSSDELAKMKADLTALKAQMAQGAHAPKAAASLKAEGPSTPTQMAKAYDLPAQAGNERVSHGGAPKEGGLAPTPRADGRGARVEGKQRVEVAAAQTGKAWAVVIGINEYEDPALRLASAKTDAQSMASLLRQQGFQVTELYDRQATGSEIMAQLGSTLAGRVGEHDRVLIYFAGQGGTEPLEDAKEMGYLFPVGAELDHLDSTAIPLSAIRDVVGALPAKKVLFLVEAKGLVGIESQKMLTQLARSTGIHIAAAASKDPSAAEVEELGHGVFTQTLLDGLSGKADGNPKDGTITVLELLTYVSSQMPEVSRQYKQQTQYPVWSSPGQDFPLALAPRVSVP